MTNNEKTVQKVDTLNSAIEITQSFKEVLSEYKTCKTKATVSTISRLIMVVIALANQILAITGTYQIPSLNEDELCIVATGITAIIMLVVYWYNNSWSDDAVVCDSLLNMMRSAGIDSQDIVDALKNLGDKTSSDLSTKLADTITESNPKPEVPEEDPVEDEPDPEPDSEPKEDE